MRHLARERHLARVPSYRASHPRRPTPASAAFASVDGGLGPVAALAGQRRVGDRKARRRPAFSLTAYAVNAAYRIGDDSRAVSDDGRFNIRLDDLVKLVRDGG